MIRLISCNKSDMQAYYNGTTLMMLRDGKPHAVNVTEILTRAELRVQDARGSFSMSRADLYVKYFEPFYTDDGRVLGVRSQRSYKRAPVYDRSDLKYLDTISDSGLTSTFNGTQGRIGSQFYVTQANRIYVLAYLGELVGFFKDNVFFVKDSCISERLRELIKKEELPYGVVQTTA